MKQFILVVPPILEKLAKQMYPDCEIIVSRQIHVGPMGLTTCTKCGKPFTYRKQFSPISPPAWCTARPCNVYTPRYRRRHK